MFKNCFSALALRLGVSAVKIAGHFSNADAENTEIAQSVSKKVHALS
jgi:hypothetical protein